MDTRHESKRGGLGVCASCHPRVADFLLEITDKNLLETPRTMKAVEEITWPSRPSLSLSLSLLPSVAGRRLFARHARTKSASHTLNQKQAAASEAASPEAGGSIRGAGGSTTKNRQQQQKQAAAPPEAGGSTSRSRRQHHQERAAAPPGASGSTTRSGRQHHQEQAAAPPGAGGSTTRSGWQHHQERAAAPLVCQPRWTQQRRRHVRADAVPASLLASFGGSAPSSRSAGSRRY